MVIRKMEFCFGITFDYEGTFIPSDFENLYQKAYKKIFSFLYSHSDFSVFLYFSGPVLEWFEKKHPEVITLLSELINRKQIEIIGGGYYSPAFPLILPIDRVGQTEALTTSIRKILGKRPRGIYLPESIWDPSLISSFKTCGIEYTFIDSRLIPQNKYRNVSLFNPLIVEDLGKTLFIIPLQEEVDFFHQNNTKDLISIIKNKIASQNNENSVFSTVFSADNFNKLLKEGILDSLYLDFIEEENFVFSTPQKYLKNATCFNRVTISATCSPNLANWIYEPYVFHSSSDIANARPNVKDFIETYPLTHELYARMIQLSVEVNQCRGDKMRKKNARDLLWETQNYHLYVYNGKSSLSNKKNRRKAFQNLISAEKILRENSDFIEHCNGYDLSMSGYKEYIAKFTNYNAYVSQKGGAIFELDVVENAVNYCDIEQRNETLDQINDTYRKKILSDHLLEENQLAVFTNGLNPPHEILPNRIYSEISFDRTKREVTLFVSLLFGKKKLPVSIVKKLFFTEGGIQAQYIIKNESNDSLKAVFAVENVFSLSDPKKLFDLEVVAMDQKNIPCSDQIFIKQEHVSFIQLSDTVLDTKFILEPNEDAGISILPLSITRVDGQEELQTQYQGQICTLFWHIDIQPNYEIEKTIYLGINPKKKTSVAKRNKKQ